MSGGRGGEGRGGEGRQGEEWVREGRVSSGSGKDTPNTSYPPPPPPLTPSHTDLPIVSSLFSSTSRGWKALCTAGVLGVP